MSRIIIANRRGHQVVEWDAGVETDEAREKGCAVSKKVGSQHVLDHGPFDPYAEEYQILAPIAGG